MDSQRKSFKNCIQPHPIYDETFTRQSEDSSLNKKRSLLNGMSATDFVDNKVQRYISLQKESLIKQDKINSLNLIGSEKPITLQNETSVNISHVAAQLMGEENINIRKGSLFSQKLHELIQRGEQTEQKLKGTQIVSQEQTQLSPNDQQIAQDLHGSLVDNQNNLDQLSIKLNSSHENKDGLKKSKIQEDSLKVSLKKKTELSMRKSKPRMKKQSVLESNRLVKSTKNSTNKNQNLSEKTSKSKQLACKDKEKLSENEDFYVSKSSKFQNKDELLREESTTQQKIKQENDTIFRGLSAVMKGEKASHNETAMNFLRDQIISNDKFREASFAFVQSYIFQKK